jgi:misacylated tRNA(Ala) deacylase
VSQLPATEPLFRADARARSCDARITGLSEEGALAVSASVFYPSGGGQPGDTGTLHWAGGVIAIGDCTKEGDSVLLHPAEGAPLPPVGADVRMELDWARRYSHMRVHTALHLLSVVIALPVTGGQIGLGKGRLDFDMPEAPQDKAALEEALNALIARDLPVTEGWITDAELAANPGLVKTMAVKPRSVKAGCG